MQIEIVLLAALLTICNAVDTADTPNILIGRWVARSTLATDDSPCCQPTGDLTITNNEVNGVTLTSTSWAGYSCEGRDSSFQDLIYVNGYYSYNQLENNYNNGTRNPMLTDAAYTRISMHMVFTSSSTSMSLVYNLNAVNSCYTIFFKSAQALGVFTALLISCIILVVA